MNYLLLLGLALPVILAQFDNKEMLDFYLNLSFLAVDGNKDGHVTFSEFHAYAETADTNKDGFITWPEYLQNSPIDVDMAGALFTYMDFNHDKKFDLNSELHKAFGLYDLDGDGELSRKEFEHESGVMMQVAMQVFSGVNPRPQD